MCVQLCCIVPCLSQVYNITDEGLKFKHLYHVTNFPYIAVIDPMTGMCGSPSSLVHAPTNPCTTCKSSVYTCITMTTGISCSLLKGGLDLMQRDQFKVTESVILIASNWLLSHQSL